MRKHFYANLVWIGEVHCWIGSGIAALAGVTFKGQWKFDDSRGALLVMVNPRATSVPDGFLPAAQNCDLFKSGHKKLVTQVFTCPAYFLYYSGKSEFSAL